MSLAGDRLCIAAEAIDTARKNGKTPLGNLPGSDPKLLGICGVGHHSGDSVCWVFTERPGNYWGIKAAGGGRGLNRFQKITQRRWYLLRRIIVEDHVEEIPDRSTTKCDQELKLVAVGSRLKKRLVMATPNSSFPHTREHSNPLDHRTGIFVQRDLTIDFQQAVSHRPQCVTPATDARESRWMLKSWKAFVMTPRGA